MNKITFHKKIAHTYTPAEGETHAFIFNKTDGSQVFASISEETTLDTDYFNDIQVGKHTAKVFKVGENSTNLTLIQELPVYVSAGLTVEISKNQEILGKITDVLAGKATDDVQAYTIAGRSISKMNLADLERLQARYAGLVREEKLGYLDDSVEATAGQKRFKNIHFKFTQTRV